MIEKLKTCFIGRLSKTVQIYKTSILARWFIWIVTIGVVGVVLWKFLPGYLSEIQRILTKMWKSPDATCFPNPLLGISTSARDGLALILILSIPLSILMILFFYGLMSYELELHIMDITIISFANQLMPFFYLSFGLLFIPEKWLETLFSNITLRAYFLIISLIWLNIFISTFELAISSLFWSDFGVFDQYDTKIIKMRRLNMILLLPFAVILGVMAFLAPIVGFIVTIYTFGIMAITFSEARAIFISYHQIVLILFLPFLVVHEQVRRKIWWFVRWNLFFIPVPKIPRWKGFGGGFSGGAGAGAKW